MPERIATINGFEINFLGDGDWEIYSSEYAVTVGTKTSRLAAEKFAMDCKGDGSGKTWEKYPLCS